MIVALDLETTGLDHHYDVVLEAAVIILDDDLNEIDSKNWVVWRSDSVLSGMNKWCTDTHTASGLVGEINSSSLDEASVAAEITAFLDKHDVSEHKPPLLGNSVHFDRAFLRKFAPEAHAMLSHRNIDVSSIKECLKRWNPDAIPEKVEVPHRAMADIRLSIKTLKAYRPLLEE